METINNYLQYSQDHLLLLGFISFISFLGSLIAIPIVIVLLPDDYFSLKESLSVKQPLVSSFLRLIFVILKNGTGVLFLAAGIAMLFLPGQGLLTIAVGLSFLDFPGKQFLLNHLVALGSVQSSMNWIRGKYGRPPLIFNEKQN